MSTVRNGNRQDVASRLRDEILSGRLSAGQRLTELEISRRYEVGRGLVRQALQQLALQGLVVTKRNCGVTVAEEAPKPIREVIVPIRCTIETYALRLIHDELTPEDFEHWEQILKEMRAACRKRDVAGVVEADIAFHRYLLERAAQPDLLAIWEMLVGRIRSHFRNAQRRLTRLMDIYDEHRAILNAIQSSDEETAVEALRSKIE